uniref:Centrosomal protein 57 like 1 n=1 Tax=Catharus ustulatus TaxID=91951 RepID=A0A8C3Y085_CATUS
YLMSPPVLMAALKALQEKICRLELEKSQAEDKLCSLSRAAAQYRKVLEYESYEKDTAHQELMQQRKDESVQLNAAQARCSLLEKQLDYMRKMVSSAEQEKKMILEQQAQLQKEEGQNWLELHAKLEKLEMLEKECLKLTATQRIAEDKIKHLEEKLCKEEHQHKLIQDKTAQIAILVFNSEHQELLEQTQESQAREDLQQELDCLVKQMEMKGRQISKLKKHQATVRMKCKLSTNILAERLPELCLLLLSARMSLESTDNNFSFMPI